MPQKFGFIGVLVGMLVLFGGCGTEDYTRQTASNDDERECAEVCVRKFGGPNATSCDQLCEHTIDHFASDTCWNLCLDMFERQFGTGAYTPCDNLCKHVEVEISPPLTTSSLDSSVGRACYSEYGCAEGLFCHPEYKICTVFCQGFCPGANTFCIKQTTGPEALWISENTGGGGICVRKDNATTDCSKILIWVRDYSVAGTGYRAYAKQTLLTRSRHIGATDAAEAEEEVCTPNFQITDRTLPAGCFASGVKVDTPTGPVNIEDLRLGDEVYAYDHDAGQVVVSRVYRSRTQQRPVIGVTFEDGTQVVATPDHPFYSPATDSYVRVDSISAGGLLAQRLPSIAQPLESMTSAQSSTVPSQLLNTSFKLSGYETLSEYPGPVTVYDIGVEKHQNFFVHGVLVHNW